MALEGTQGEKRVSQSGLVHQSQGGKEGGTEWGTEGGKGTQEAKYCLYSYLLYPLTSEVSSMGRWMETLLLIILLGLFVQPVSPARRHVMVLWLTKMQNEVEINKKSIVI